MVCRARRWVVPGLAGLLVLVPTPHAADNAPAFGDWVADLRHEAAAQGIRSATLDVALSGIAPVPRVLELDQDQPEFKLSFAEYLARVAPPARVTRGRQLLAENRPLLEEIRARYGVQPRVVVALWGVETDFGRLQGGFRVIEALATLAYDGRRSAFFRRELLAALHILDEGHVAPAEFLGSWAGATGQCQFMPTTFRQHAVDFNGDGRCNIWSDRADALASGAQYLASAGWQGDRLWGRRVRLPAGLDSEAAGLDRRRPLSEWQALGVRRADGRDLPRAPNLDASLILPDGDGGPAFLVYDNFRALMAWNRSIHFATAVGILSDRIGGR